jgi:hypothetical protein
MSCLAVAELAGTSVGCRARIQTLGHLIAAQRTNHLATPRPIQCSRK